MSLAPGATAAPSPDMPRVLYLSFEGILEPLGRSQVLRYVTELASLSERPWRYDLVTLERAGDLADAGAIERQRRELAALGIRWRCDVYASGGVRAVLRNWRVALALCRALYEEAPFAAIHVRSHVPAVVAWRLARAYRVPYIFDIRCYWVDERAQEGRWFTNPVSFALGKYVERRLLRDAAAVVTLTALQADDLRRGLLADRHRPVVVIPTCADYEEFTTASRNHAAVTPEARQRLAGKLVLGMVGSINRSYYVEESLRLFRYVRELRPEAHLLCLTRQPDQMQQLLKEHGVPESAYTLATVPHEQMKDWLGQIHWGLLLLKQDFAKRGSMPTKLAEFFAAGVRPVQHGCNEEVSSWVLQAGSGMVLPGVGEADLRAAAQQIVIERGADELERARTVTRTHFGLEAGVARYAELLQVMVPREQA